MEECTLSPKKDEMDRYSKYASMRKSNISESASQVSTESVSSVAEPEFLAR